MMIRCVAVFFFCFKQKTAYDMRISDWSSRRVLFRSQRCRGLRRVSPARGAAPCRCDLNELHPLGRAAARTEPRADPGARVPAVLPAGGIVRRGRGDRKSVVEGKSVSVSLYLGGRRIIKKPKIQYQADTTTTNLL